MFSIWIWHQLHLVWTESGVGGGEPCPVIRTDQGLFVIRIHNCMYDMVFRRRCCIYCFAPPCFLGVPGSGTPTWPFGCVQIFLWSMGTWPFLCSHFYLSVSSLSPFHRIFSASPVCPVWIKTPDQCVLLVFLLLFCPSQPLRYARSYKVLIRDVLCVVVRRPLQILVCVQVSCIFLSLYFCLLFEQCLYQEVYGLSFSSSCVWFCFQNWAKKLN